MTFPHPYLGAKGGNQIVLVFWRLCYSYSANPIGTMAIRPICFIIIDNSAFLYQKTFEMCLGGKYYQACLLETSITIYGSTSLYIAVIQIRRGL
jgi:hypothetical protein